MKVAIIAAVLAAFAGGFVAAQQSELLGPLNTGVNALFDAAGVPNHGSGKVVPIITSGGAPAGYAQVIGSPSAVNATKAVVQVSTSYGGAWSITALIPVTSVSRSGGTMRRATGVAVDAVINAHL